jgi:hypothetical protein
MALNSDYFRLSAGLAHAWNTSPDFTSDYKKLVASAISGANKDYPESEDQLDRLQMALIASKFLRSLEAKNEVQWLNETSRELPRAFQSFIHTVAVYFHDSGERLSRLFMENLAGFIDSSRSHVAVLNYDNLLYDALTREKILDGYKGALIDGFHYGGFHVENLNRNYPERLGWYLHLHGSPLFIGNKKLMRSDRNQLDPTHASHIVLTHVKHKSSIIDASPILSEYWKRLDQAFDESAQIILFGYSGFDTHLNHRIVSGAVSSFAVLRKPVHIVEWDGGQPANKWSRMQVDEREGFWKKQLPGCDVTLHHLRNILEFKEWHCF